LPPSATKRTLTAASRHANDPKSQRGYLSADRLRRSLATSDSRRQFVVSQHSQSLMK
jgi:hypothetical protein